MLSFTAAVPTDHSNRPPPRFQAIDELRALAVMSMCLAHFAPGLLMRVKVLAPLTNSLLIAGKLSTVAFVVTFGLTLGFVQWPRFIGDHRSAVTGRLIRRAWQLGACAMLVSLPAYAALWTNGRPDAWPEWAFSTYSVLNFYVLSVLSAPLWLWMLRRDTSVRAMLLSALHWMAFMLIDRAWPTDPQQPALELLRLHLVSGGYAFLPLAATTLLVVPVGIRLREWHAEGRAGAWAPWLVATGTAIALFGFALGAATEMSVAGLVDGRFKGPPRLWYWALFGGATLALLGLLTLAHSLLPGLARHSRPVALFGQAALAIFTTHAWVLPMVNWLDDAGLVIEGVWRGVLAMALFALLCGLSMAWHGRKQGRRTRTRAAAPPSTVSNFAPSSAMGLF